MILHGRQVAQQSGLPFYYCNQHQQQGNSFGEKLSHAISWVFAQGHNKVIVLGNDCPAITVDVIFQAKHCLNNRGVVIGPDARGGIYLLGLGRSAFEMHSFKDLPWQTPRLAEAMIQLYGREASLISQQPDLNCFQDLPHQMQRIVRSSHLYTLLHSLVMGINRVERFILPTKSYLPVLAGLRAPPGSL